MTGFDSSRRLDVEEPDTREYLIGWKLNLLTLALCMSLLLSTLETTIISTSLVSITNALKGFDQSSWIVNSYLLSYAGFLVIYAKFSDIYGRKALMLIALSLFTAFSVACGVARNIVDLIVLRAFQGLGGSGIYSIVLVVTPDLTPLDKLGPYMAGISSVFAIASVLGPILGGAISDNSTWRWVFLLNAPAGSVAIALIAFLLPSNYPNKRSTDRKKIGDLFSRKSFRKLDLLGAFFSLAGSVSLIFGLQSGGTRYPWRSPAIITSLTLSGIFWIAFAVWEWIVGRRPNSSREPVFPLHIARNRTFACMLFNTFLTGFPFMVAIINIPQRFQAVNGVSPTSAGLRLLPLLICSPLASGMASMIVTKAKVPPVYLLQVGAALQTIGVGLMSSISTTRLEISAAQYGFEVIMGFGFGLSLVAVLLATPLIVLKKDIGVAMGSLTQVRVLGGAVGLAICATVLNRHLRSSLSTASSTLSPAQLDALLQSTSAISIFPASHQKIVREVLAVAYNRQLRIVTYVAAAAFVAGLGMWGRNGLRMRSVAEEQERRGEMPSTEGD